LRAIEKATGTIEKMELPSVEQVTDKRIGKFKQRITETLDTVELDLFRKLVEDYQGEYGVPVMDIAAALGAMAQGSKLLVAKPGKERSGQARSGKEKPRKETSKKDKSAKERPSRTDRAEDSKKKFDSDKKKTRSSADSSPGGVRPESTPDKGLERYRIEVGHEHDVKPANIVGAIANEAEIDAEYIGRIEIYNDHSTVDLPEGMPKEIFTHLKSVWVSGQRLKISRADKSAGKKKPHRKGPAKRKSKKSGPPKRDH
jgi:ATP-dependent RNA helicase DeaD